MLASLLYGCGRQLPPRRRAEQLNLRSASMSKNRRLMPCIHRLSLFNTPLNQRLKIRTDDVESLRRVVHNIKTLVEKVPETSEVCWTIFISNQHFKACSHPFTALALRKHCLGSHVLSAQGMDNNSCLVSYSDDFRITVGRSGDITREWGQPMMSSPQ